jgi:DNA replication protein DnaC
VKPAVGLTLPWAGVTPAPSDFSRSAAMLDRVLHHSAIVSINGESFRLKDKRKAGILGKSAKNWT